MKHNFGSSVAAQTRTLAFVGAAAACLLQAPLASAEPTLTGWASLPADTFSPGPTSGQFALSTWNSQFLPIDNGQPVQGFSGVLEGPKSGTYYVQSDNGFGNQANSADAVLRVYAVKPEFKRWDGRRVVGSGTVSPFEFDGRKTLGSFDEDSFITLNDPDHKLGYALQADYQTYYNNAANPAVDEAIKAERLVTGADLDIESIRKDKRGNLWFGDEFGPFLVKTDETGKVLRAEIPTPNFKPKNSTAAGEYVQSPSNPYLDGATPNLNNSNGFEGLALNKSGDKLYPLLEGTVIGDPAKSLRIYEFDLKTEAYTRLVGLYALDAQGTNIGDFTAINDHEFIVIERNNNTATTADAPFKRLYVVDIADVDNAGFVRKTELVDLLNIADPHDLNSDGNKVFTFPYVTIEDVLIVDRKTLLVINDNNYPGTGGRTTTAPDINEFLLIGLDDKLDVGGSRGRDDKPGHGKGHGWGGKDFGKTHGRR